MIARMMASALAIIAASYAEQAAAQTETGCAPTPTCAPPQAASAAGRLVYEATFFASFNPQNAMDMVSQTPGFSLNGGDDRRGFSGAVGNLLIDGLRPSTKSQSLDSLLQRIPASQVLRIEVLRGAEVAGDASGQSVLLNVVRTPGSGSGLWRLGGEQSEGFGPQGEISYNGRNGQVEYGAGLEYYSQYRLQPGRRRIHDGAGALIETADTPSPRDFRQVTLTGNASAPLWGGRLSSNAQAHSERFNSLSSFFFFDPLNAPTRQAIDHATEHNDSAELGLNFDRDIGPWSLALIGLLNRGRGDSFETVVNTGGSGNSTFTQDVESESGESILRGSLSRALGARHRIEFGAEGAFNSLDQKLALTNDTGGGPVVLSVPNSNVLVEEERLEAFFVHSWRPNDRWGVETRLAGEQSTLTFTGDTNQTVELAFFKPSIQVSRTLGERNQVRFRVYRDVGQLNFDDFVSAAGINDNLIEGGNPDLRPEIDWRAEFGADLRFPGDAALNITLTRHWLEDVADVVKLTNDNGTPGNPADDSFFDAPGNIGEADAWSLETSLTLPLRAILPGARLTIENTLWDTAVVDPVTGQTREFSGRPEITFNADFRQDINSWDLAWGFSYFKQSQAQTFRFNEIDTYEEGPWVDVFVESTAIEGVRLRLTAANVLDGEIRRQRNFFTPDRAGSFDRLDERQREFDNDPWFIFQASGSF